VLVVVPVEVEVEALVGEELEEPVVEELAVAAAVELLYNNS